MSLTSGRRERRHEVPRFRFIASRRPKEIGMVRGVAALPTFNAPSMVSTSLPSAPSSCTCLAIVRDMSSLWTLNEPWAFVSLPATHNWDLLASLGSTPEFRNSDASLSFQHANVVFDLLVGVRWLMFADVVA